MSTGPATDSYGRYTLDREEPLIAMPGGAETTETAAEVNSDLTMQALTA